MTATPQYVAGFIDGEGSLAINKKYGVFVTIGQVDPRPLVAIQRVYPGHLRQMPGRGNWRAYWTLTIHGHQAVRLLREILPYLIVKSEQAEMLLGVMALKKTAPTRVRLTSFEVAERESYRLALLDLRAAG